MSYRTRNQLILASIQSAIGTEETLVIGDAIRARNPRWSPNFETIETDYVQSSLSRSAPIVGGGNVGIQLGAFLTGAGTAGTAPDYGVLLRAAGLSETLTAADVAGTAQAGGAATITLASGASAVDDAYKGMVIRTTDGTGSGQVGVITGYVGSTKVATVLPAWDTEPDATTDYSIDANALYRPVSTGLELATVWGYLHPNSGNSRRRRIFDAAANFTLRAPPRGLAEIDFTLTGLLPAAPDDVSSPGVPTHGSANPEPLIAAEAYLGGAAVNFSEFSLDMGNDVQMEDAVGAAYGYDSGQVVARSVSGRIAPSMRLTSVRDAFADWLGGVERDFWLRWGTTAGRRVSLLVPRVRYTGYEETDVRGFAAEGLPFRGVGDDAEIYICIH